jgi:transposase
VVAVRGRQDPQASMLAFIDVETLIPVDHPLRAVKYLVDQTLAELSPLFDTMYAEIGRPSIPPERLLKASLLMSLYSIRSERAFCEQLNYNLLFRWFLGMTMVEPTFDLLQEPSAAVGPRCGRRVLRRGAGRGADAAVAVG